MEAFSFKRITTCSNYEQDCPHRSESCLAGARFFGVVDTAPEALLYYKLTGTFLTTAEIDSGGNPIRSHLLADLEYIPEVKA